MKKEITLTEDIINQLKNEGWLSDKQFTEYMGDGLGLRYSYKDMVILCKDYDLLDSLFEEKLEDEDIKDVTYSVIAMHYGECIGGVEEFNNINDAIKLHYSLKKGGGNNSYLIQVNYKVVDQ